MKRIKHCVGRRAGKAIPTRPKLILILSVGILIAAIPAAASTHMVHPEAGDYTSIQEAIDVASEGDLIIVAAGEYAESLTIETGLTLIGDGDVVLRPGDASTAITIDASGPVSIRNITILDALVGIASSSSCTISDCGVTAALFGMFLEVDEEAFVTIHFCSVQSAAFGVVVGGNYGIANIIHSDIMNARLGITVGGSVSTRVSSSTIEACELGILVSGTARTTLELCLVVGCSGNAIQLTDAILESFAEPLTVIDCIFADTTGWLLSACNPDTGEVVDRIAPIRGSGNSADESGLGAACPGTLSLPEGFLSGTSFLWPSR